MRWRRPIRAAHWQPSRSIAARIAGAWIEVTGWSMSPLIRPGDELYVEFGDRRPRRGEIAVFREGELMIAHRVVGGGRSGSRKLLITRGDGMATFDPPFPAEEVLGVVRAVSPTGADAERPDSRAGSPGNGCGARVGGCRPSARQGRPVPHRASAAGGRRCPQIGAGRRQPPAPGGRMVGAVPRAEPHRLVRGFDATDGCRVSRRRPASTRSKLWGSRRAGRSSRCAPYRMKGR